MELKHKTVLGAATTNMNNNHQSIFIIESNKYHQTKSHYNKVVNLIHTISTKMDLPDTVKLLNIMIFVCITKPTLFET